MPNGKPNMQERVEELVNLFDNFKFKEYINTFDQLEESEFDKLTLLEQVLLLFHQYNSYNMIQNQEQAEKILTKLEKSKKYTDATNPGIKLMLVTARIFYDYFVLYNFDLNKITKLSYQCKTLSKKIMASSEIEESYKQKLVFLYPTFFGLAFYKHDKYEESIQLLKEAYEIAIEIKTPYFVQISYENLREALEYVHDLNQILELSLRTKNILIDLQLELNALYMDIGIAYLNYNLGRVEKAKDLATETLTKLLRLNKKGSIYTQNLIYCYNVLGSIELWYGNYDKAISYHREGLKIDPNNTVCLSNLSRIYLEKREIEKSIEYQKRCLEIRKKVHFSEGIAYSYHRLINAYLELDDIESGKQFLTLLKELSDKINDVNIMLIAEYSEALVLKKNKSFKNLSRAQELFEEIVERPMVNIEITSKSIIHLIELSLYEYTVSSEEKNIQKITELMNSLYELGNKTKSNPIIIESLILKGKLEILKGKISEANDLFEKALAISEDKELVKLTEKAKNEQKILNKELKRWNSLIESNESLKEKIDKLELLEYIKEASKTYKTSFNTLNTNE